MIPDQYRGTDMDAVERMLNDKNVKPCPDCGARIYIGMTGSDPQPAWQYDRCTACGHETIIEL